MEEPVLRRVMRSEKLLPAAPGEPHLRGAKVGRAEVLMVRLESGLVAAFAAHCPHQGTPLDGATLFDDSLRCPRHVFLYDLKTGENLVPARVNKPETLCKLKPGYLPIHRAEERDGWIWVSEAPEPPPAAYDPLLEKGPPPAEEPAAPATARPADVPPAGTGSGVVYATAGEELEIVLPTTVKPGHFWTIVVSEGAATVLSQVFAPDDPPRNVVRLLPRVPGDVTVSCAYGTPWGPAPAETQTVEVRIAPAPS
ncbi:MAG TPA: Rieske 2Fe-2S domain-containing protein [Acidimicrobiales bacterium]|nr:Rieske 2Fe-2S domain-containing protein [Acidimicrobiales bacterium]